MQVTHDSGTGRSVIIVHESGYKYKKYVDSIINSSLKNYRKIIFECDNLNDENWQKNYEKFRKLLDDLNIRLATFISFADSGTLVQQLALEELKKIKTLVLFDPTCRAHPSLLMKLTDKIESFLPLGLPLRITNSSYDSKPFLHRIRCPVLIIATTNLSSYEKDQIQVFSEKLPCAWNFSVSENDFHDQLSELIDNFQEVPTKCPQKTKMRGI